jgi:glucosamine--fructose-6-phosphate aminotransferase (isomerizing)
VFADPEAGIHESDGVTVIEMPKHVTYFQAPTIYTIPLQLLAYHVAILRGTDVDQPRNLAKSVTVE